MEEDEISTVRTLESCRSIMAEVIERYRGRVVDSPGDNLLAEFPSVVDAVECAVEVQKEMKTKNAELHEKRRMQFRIGINLGDVIEEGDRIYGDGVNIAARIEGLSEAGGICISGTAYDQIESKLGLEYEYMGERIVKNISKPVRVYQVLMKSEDTTAKDSRAIDLPDNPSIAVLPFDNMSDDPKQEYFSDGLSEEIITALSKVPKLLVIARNSTFTYKGKPVKVQQVGEELGVRYVLEGSLRKAGERVRITAQLSDAITGQHVWAERYDSELKDIFALQDSITLKILQAMQVKLTDGEQARVYGKGTDNLEAYLKWLQGKEYLTRARREGIVLGRQMFEETLSLDPNWAQAYVLLGWTYLLESFFGWSTSPEESLNEAFKLAQKALTLDDSIPGPYGLLSQIYILKRQHDQAIEKARRAVELEPNLSFAYTWLGAALMYAGRPEEAISLYQKAIRLNPFPPAYYLRDLGEAYRMAERYEEAITAFKKTIQSNPDHLEAHLGLACVYSILDRNDDNREEVAEVLRINPDFSLKEHIKTYPYKNRADLDTLIDALKKAGLK
jgi:adenylate cyclase